MNIYPYAGFWKRVLAHIIDGIVLFIPTLIVQQLFGGVSSLGQNGITFSAGIFLDVFQRAIPTFLLVWLYNAFMESSQYQASLGKMALGLKVIDKDGKRIGFGRATCRCLGRILSGNFTVNFGYYMAGFTRHRQTLHDYITDTFVVEKTYEKTQPELPSLPFQQGYFVISICMALLPFFLLLAFFAFLLFAAGAM